MSRPVHLRASFLGLALLGGTLGTAAREALSLTIPSLGGIPVAIFGINLLGAFLLGLLLETLARLGPDDGARRKVRILVGTGFMGGFTTYSALAVDTAGLLNEGRIGTGSGYGLATVVLGGMATWAGIVLGSLTRRSGAPEDGVRLPIDPDTAEVGDRLGASPEVEAQQERSSSPEPRTQQDDSPDSGNRLGRSEGDPQ
ncbi:fluoride efflux transporter FluC [Brevibacterium metallidurans]|uniref:Fluoride-specific ion channel FluC n=1 Tax=Brevibacterium metallidurans TaxID=1482676 RepID=A0ABP3CBT0_9MICO